ncbi:hypothetical protein WMF26_49290 [Sorangium sp. So ce185]|uniref:hypothetical protein n=1 Tax=Sorangium sp. So ce185 TaxID=3133287 RepID=UPI003F5D84EB
MSVLLCEGEDNGPDVRLLHAILRGTGVQVSRYVAQLERVFDALGHVTAARIALTCCAPRRNRLETQVRLDATEQELAQELRDKADAYTEGARLDKDKLLQAFERHVPDCLSGGRFRQHALEVFAGKNILAKIQHTPGFHPILKRKPELEERILNALEHDAEPHSWLPEWAALRSAVGAWMPAPETEATSAGA